MNIPIMQHRTIIGMIVASFCLSGCGSSSEESTPMLSRPVSVLELRERDFERESRLTGSVSLYREERVGFEVGGRVVSVLDVGHEVQGPSYNEDGKMLRQGDEIAQLDRRRYELQVSALEARLRSLNKQLDAQHIEVEHVAKNEIEAAQRGVDSAAADLKLASQTLERERLLVTTNASSRQALDEAQRGFDAATAGKLQAVAMLETSKGGLALKETQLDAMAAQIDELTQQLEVAKEDLDDCVLHAPFNGRITRIHTTEGAVVEKGTQIVMLSLMDPMQINVAVSAAEDRKIQTGDRVMVFPKDPINPDGEEIEVPAIVYEKGAVADPATRTFQIDLMARNQRRLVHHALPEAEGWPVITDYWPVARRYQGEKGPLFVQTDCVYLDSGKFYVLRLPGVSLNSGGNRSAVGKHVPDKIEVKLGDEYFAANKLNFRSLAASGDLKEGDILAAGPSKEHEAGLVIGRPQWLLRPGDLVPVSILLETTPRGFYVPVSSIVTRGGSRSVFIADDGVARLRNVAVHETYGELRRIEGDGIEAGTKIIVRGVHYVSDGQPISVMAGEKETL
jgi:multidrug efflux pump subunit AcrA (membrane-fusion protein)